MNDSILQKIEALEALWRDKVRDAYERLIAARARGKNAVERFRAGVMEDSHDMVEMRNVAQEEHVAGQEFRRVLQTFSDLVVRGKIPDE